MNGWETTNNRQARRSKTHSIQPPRQSPHLSTVIPQQAAIGISQPAPDPT
jgi:hypothetical protein